MKLETPADWCAFVDSLRERGAVAVKIQVHPDGSLMSIECNLRPPAPQLAASPRTPPESDAKPRPKPLPAGLGYGV